LVHGRFGSDENFGEKKGRGGYQGKNIYSDAVFRGFRF
jgi:hypothetical protein